MNGHAREAEIPPCGPQAARGATGITEILRDLDPHQKPGVWVYAELPHDAPLPPGTMVAVMEDEARTVVLSENEARAAGVFPLFRAAWITLRVHSALEAVGLVANVSSSLAEAGIPCNVIAGARHDHILVPHKLASEAMAVLRTLQRA